MYDIITKPSKYEKIPNNQVHAFLLSRLPNKYSERAHTPGNHCLFTYGSQNIDYERNRGSFIFSSLDEPVEDLIVSLRMNEMFRLGKYQCKLYDIREIDLPDTSLGNVLLRGRILLSVGDRSRTIRKKEEAELWLGNITENKLKEIGINERLDFNLLRIRDTKLYYKKQQNEDDNGHLPAADVVMNVSGSQEALDTFLKFGAGQNTGTGAGMMWEV